MSVDARSVPAALNIRSQQGDYDVDFFENTRALGTVIEAGPDTFVLVDATVRGLYPALFGGFAADRILALPASEDVKTLSGVEKVATFLQSGGASRASTLIVAGGGIIQDIGTFAAHIFYRGIPYVYLPTTLLSMADSCIGAKCGVNLGPYKNQLGFFASPSRVAIAPEFLETLPGDDVRSGFGEILKLSITSGDEAFDWFEAKLNANGFELSSVGEAISRSLSTKRTVIEVDEYEKGLRKTLNYGHTFGHALESVTDHEVPHGLAVAWGVDVANYVAMVRGRLSRFTYDRVHALISAHFRFKTRCKYDAALLLAAMKRDKKAASGSVQLILPAAIGRLEIVPSKIDAALERDIASYLERDNIGST